MSNKAIILSLFVALLASQVVGVAGVSADSVPYYGGLYCSPAAQSVASGEYVSFTANADYTTGVWPQPQLTWNAVGGNPSYGYGTTFGTRFYTGSYSETRTVSVTDGTRTSYCTVYVYSASPTPTPVQQVYLTPQSPAANSGDTVTFSAWGGNGTYSWSATEGNPVSGWGSTFTTRFYNYTGSTLYREVVVTSGSTTARTWVSIRPTATPTPSPYQTLQCYPSYKNANSGDLVSMSAWGGDGNYSWTAVDGNPSYGYGSSFSTRFYNYMSYTQNRSVTVTSAGQTTTCTIIVASNYGNPTPTVSPNPDARIELRLLGRNVTRGQTGENTTLRARGDDTLDLIVRIRSTNGSYMYNAYVTDFLPAGLSYISRSTTLNGYEVADGITSSGINVGTLQPNTDTVVKFSVRVDGAYVPTWGTITINDTAQVRADGLNTMSVQLPITMGQNLNLATVSGVKTGPADSLWLALLVSVLVTGAYAAYTRSDMFGRRMALVEVSRLSRSTGLNFSK